jgi:23S rRNA G2069 N7-methylase RlmK/C1962 C5-methylase RlmI
MRKVKQVLMIIISRKTVIVTALAVLSTYLSRRYGLILLAPPSIRRATSREDEAEVERDLDRLIGLSAGLLLPEGELLLATEMKSFEPRPDRRLGLWGREITEEVTPPDFSLRPGIRVWSIRRSAP